MEGAGSFAPPPPPLSSMDSEMILRAALPAEVGLDEEELETLREVEERLESNKAQLEYKDRKIVSIQKEVCACVGCGLLLFLFHARSVLYWLML